MSGAAVIIGASGGIGGAFRTLLEEEGAFAPVHAFARSFTGANHIDLLDEASIAAAAARIAVARGACAKRTVHAQLSEARDSRQRSPPISALLPSPDAPLPSLSPTYTCVPQTPCLPLLPSLPP